MQNSEERDLREGVFYDAYVKGLDANFWDPDTGTVTATGGKLRYTSAGNVSYAQFLYGDFEFALNVPTSPSAAEAKEWGLINPGDSDQRGSIYFQIDTEFYTVTEDETGAQRRTLITWDTNWDGVQTRYRFVWEEDGVRFLINDTVIATHGGPYQGGTSSIQINTSIPLSLRIRNGDADNTDLGFVNIRNARKVI